MKSQIILCLIFSFVVFSCEKNVLGTAALNAPENNFELPCNDLDHHYTLLGVKQIDWDGLYKTYRTNVNESIMEAQLLPCIAEKLNPEVKNENWESDLEDDSQDNNDPKITNTTPELGHLKGDGSVGIVGENLLSNSDIAPETNRSGSTPSALNAKNITGHNARSVEMKLIWSGDLYRL